MDNLIHLGRDEPLALYLSPGRMWASRLRDLLANDERPCKGVRIDPAQWNKRQEELVDVANAAGVETILDPRSLELASGEGRDRQGVSALPWAGSDIHDPRLLSSFEARLDLVGRIAEFAVANRLSAVLAPTHFLRTVRDEWNAVDDSLVSELRRALDRRGGERVVLYRPLYLHADIVRDLVEIERLRMQTQKSPTDGIWLAVHPFGTSNSGALALRRYTDACRVLHRANLPLVGMHTGTVGLMLMALGAVGGIESGIADGETFDIEQRVKRPRIGPDGKRMGGGTRVYLPTLQMFLTTREAQAFFGTRGMVSRHVCQSCCHRGVADMLASRGEHYMRSRAAEVGRLSDYPRHRRAKLYLDETLRPACDMAAGAVKALPRMGNVRRRLDTWREAYSALLYRYGGEIQSFASPPTGKRIRPRRAG